MSNSASSRLVYIMNDNYLIVYRENFIHCIRATERIHWRSVSAAGFVWMNRIWRDQTIVTKTQTITKTITAIYCARRSSAFAILAQSLIRCLHIVRCQNTERYRQNKGERLASTKRARVNKSNCSKHGFVLNVSCIIDTFDWVAALE